MQLNLTTATNEQIQAFIQQCENDKAAIIGQISQLQNRLQEESNKQGKAQIILAQRNQIQKATETDNGNDTEKDLDIPQEIANDRKTQ